MPLVRKPRAGRGGRGSHSDDDESTPICRCRVLYLGSAVPHITKDGLQGIQEPLKELYPDSGLSSLKGIDSWLSVWSNGLLLENVDEKNTKITRFFPIESLHYCAAVRNVLVPANAAGSSSTSSEKVQKFLPLDSPFARLPNLNHPPLFACILRRTTGIKVLECHAFICKREMAANALVRCCFHAYADSTYAKQLENGGTLPNGMSLGNHHHHHHEFANGTNGSTGTLFKDTTERPIQRSVTPLDSIEKVAGWQTHSQNGDADLIMVANSTDDDFTDGPLTSTPRNKYEFSAEFPDEDEIYEGDENHKIWGGSTSNLGQNGTAELVYLEPDGTLKSVKSHNSRITKPRQFISPPPPPPPPPPQQFSLLKSAEDDASSTKKKTKKKMKKEMKAASSQQKHLIRPASMMNLSSSAGLQPGMPPGRPGSVLNGPISHRPSSAMSTLTRSRPLHPPPHHPHHPQHPQHHQLMPVPHPQHPVAVMPQMHHPQPIYGHLPPPPHHHPFAIQAPLMKGSKSKKKQKQQMLTAVPLLAPTPIPMGMPHPGMQVGPGPNPHNNATPPPMFHHPKMGPPPEDSKGRKHSPEMMMMPSHYATIERGYHYHSGPPSRQMMNGHGHHHPSQVVGMSNGHGGHVANGGMELHRNGGMELHRNGGMELHRNGGMEMHRNGGMELLRNGGMELLRNGGMELLRNGDSATMVSNKSKSKSSSKEEPGSSPFNTGIYRKKGHLNERAFSYSIRQEHRSRSYGSLANLQFANENGGPLLKPSGTPPHTAEGMKKEREIIQMIRDLDLSADDIERSQVPIDMYPSRKANGYRQQNGMGHHGPRITHR